MSLRWRIMGWMVFVIVLTVLINVAVGYYATQARLGEFVDQIGNDEASRLARNLSREYTGSGGWETVGRVLSQAGYGYEATRSTEVHGEGENEGETGDLFHQDPIRVVITGLDRIVVKDNLSELLPGTAASRLDGRRDTIFDLASGQPVGHVYVDANHAFLSSESHGFLTALLYITMIGGILTAGIAILLAVWLSKRITAPVTALTEATQAIAQGDTTELPVTSSDELGRMSTAFNRMTAALKNQRELRTRLINDVSHELNTPLSVIQLEATGLRDGLHTPEIASDHIIQEVARLRGLVTDLNWLAETDSGEFRLTLEAIPIDDLLFEEVGRWLPQAQAQDVALSLQTLQDLPTANLDRMRMSQALGNLVSNALLHTNAGGTVLVRAELEDDGAVAISVIDDGSGIDTADLPHIFERFYRADQSRNRGIGGTGLGLAITRVIVEGHGGTITLASEGRGKGAVATMRLPICR